MDGNKFEQLKNRILHVLREHWRQVGAFALAVALLAFLLYHTLGLEQVRADTVAAVRSVEYEIAGLEGYVFRDEQVVYSKNSGAAVYLVDDGARVAADTELARVYSVGNTAEYLAERGEIEARAALIEQAIALGRPTIGGMDDTEAALTSSYSAFMAALNRGDMAGASEASEALLIALYADGILRGDTALSEELASLNARLTALNNSFSGGYEAIKNERGCYFYYSTDGYEQIFDTTLLWELDASGLRTLASRQPQTQSAEGTAVGRIVNNYEWYMAASAGGDVCGKLAEGGVYDVTLTDGRVLKMTLERIDMPETGDGILVFSCGVMSDIPEGRVLEVQLLVDSVSGYRVPEKALYQQKGFDGVYVLSSSEVIWRRVNVLYRGEGYVVVAERDYSTENYKEFLNLNDQIIISLSDGELYDGRILN